jgi:tRNA 5-methylaminomethyl-2-thiouridine biosynthesis bifunctional protein
MARYHPIIPAQLDWDETTPQSHIPKSREHGDIYFSRDGGVDETHHVFLHSNHLPQRWQTANSFTIAETGFGTGLNFLCTVDLWLKSAPDDARLHFISVEKHPLTHSDLQRALSSWPQFKAISDQLLDAYPPLVFGLHRRDFFDGRVTLTLLFGDATEMFSELNANVDAWYLDGFAPSKNPQMWNEALFKQIARLTKPDGSFATFTAAGVVRRGLKEVGFEVNTITGFGRKREMLCGQLVNKPAITHSQPWFHYSHTTTTPEAIVIGGGLAGTSVSHALAKRHWKVTLIERHAELAQEASGNHSGVVLPRLTADMGNDGRFYLSAFLHTVQWLNELKKRDATLPWFASGVLQLEDEKQQARLQQLSLPQEIIEFCDALTASERCGVTTRSSGVFYPMAGWTEPPALCRWLINDQHKRITPLLHQQALSLHRDGELWQVIGPEGIIATAPVVIIANGYDAQRLLGNDAFTLQKVRGQIAYLPATSQSAKLKTPICYDGYLIPAYKGLHCTGATYDVKDESNEIKESDRDKIITALKKALPEFDAQPTTSGRLAFRTSTQDHLPIIGPVPDLNFYRENYHDMYHGKPAHRYPPAQHRPNIYITTGHGSRGLVTCPMAAEMIAAVLNDEPLPLMDDVLYAVHPARFVVRKMKKRP